MDTSRTIQYKLYNKTLRFYATIRHQNTTVNGIFLTFIAC